ncbi:16S rRNA processing protein RimM [Solidesulfovibrio carbinoliphilus subsp. oakridgensis]|uniref:Ribosome maturation factor RimM n=1 Tax=Solidesulfovibrio carbinoliphilus subsp. oakridgensis TaxID=694327 RepID=G7QBC4_9BACT|nr:ribosome maturation factor RimM [Solidesulfovibrio carbinoliphilus]EHJ49347.1 16S rRNA processing protein RimM [Solidesulfovibrio carbinoliphilus subsp. oakridgensis]
MAADKYIIVGDVGRPHGIRGELGINSHADSPSYFARGALLRLSPPADPGRGKDYVVRAARPHQGRILVTLDGVSDRNAAEALRGLAVCVPVSKLDPPDPGEVFLHELLGLRVRLAGAQPADPDLGVLEDVRDSGGAELWIIRDAKGREILFPAADELVPDLDLEARIAVIDPPPGLLELYQVDDAGEGEGKGKGESE